ncbi:MAG: DUF5722 domain-containing protein [Candidatus Cryptobacteroides sp.]
MKRNTLRLLTTAAILAVAGFSSPAQTLSWEEKVKVADNIDSYLGTAYPSRVKKVVVTEDKVTISGVCSGEGTFLLADIVPWQDVTELSTFPYTTGISGGKFRITLDRYVKGREGIDYDRVFSKWAVVKVEGSAQKLDSHARYADEVAPKASPEPLKLRNKKGFGAGGGELYLKEVKEIGIGSVTTNIHLVNVLSGEGDDYEYGGVSYAFGKSVESIRKHLDALSETDVVVSAIILCAKNSVYADPENDGGFYAMPDLTSAKAFNVYAAALEYLASSYWGQNGGRISHWIMQNEVDMGHEWTNMGKQPEMRLFDRYVKSMRICYNIARQYDPNASVLESMTHNWADGDKGGYSPKRMLEKTLEYSRAEGDFLWGIAYHPYPQDLSRPKFWEDDIRSTFDRNSDYVTFKNLEVIDEWILRKEHFYNGRKRPLFLSEQGTNSPSYSDEDLTLQAAGAAWAWKKASALKGIDAIQWHGWRDSRGEFGLRIGLHTFADGDYKELQPKPAFKVWAAAGTEDEDKVFAPYLEVLGLKSWDQIMHKLDKE